MATRTLNRTIETRFPDIVLAGCVTGFVFLLIELYLYQHYQHGSQIIGFSATALGIVLAALGFLRVRAVRGVVMVLLGLLMLIGVFGVLEHREARGQDAARFAQRQAAAVSGTTGQRAPAANTTDGSDTAGAGGPRAFHSNIPVLSPLALSALSALTLLSMVARGGIPLNRIR